MEREATWLVVSIIVLMLISASAVGWTNDMYPSGLSIQSYAESVDGQRRFVAMFDGGFWRSMDGGSSWEPINSRIIPNPEIKLSVCFEVRVIDPAADTVFVKMKNEGVWESIFSQFAISIDGGDTWNLVDPDNANDFNDFQHLIVDRWNHNRLWFLNTAHMATSSDFGQTWDTWVYDDFFIGHSKRFFEQDPVDSLTFYTGNLPVGSSNIVSVWKTTDGGLNWFPSFNPDSLMEFSPVINSIAFSDNDMYAVSDMDIDINSDDNQIYQNRLFIREGGSWSTSVLRIPPLHRIETIVIDPLTPNRILLGTWSLSNDAIGLFTSMDGGTVWENNGNGLPPDLSSVKPIVNPHSNEILLCTKGYGLFSWSTNEDTWSPVDLSLDVGRGLLFSVNQNYIIANGVYDRRIQLYSFDAESWQELEYPAADDDSLALPLPVFLEGENDWTTLQCILPKDATVQYSTEILSSTDAGQSWTRMSFLQPPGYMANGLPRKSPQVLRNPDRTMLFLPRSDVGYHDIQDIVSVSIDSGRTWQHSEQFEHTSSASFAMHDTSLYLAAYNEGVYHSEDWGASWSSLEFPDSSAINYLGNNQIFVDGETGEIFVFGFEQFYRYDGESWSATWSYDYPPPDNAMIPGDPPTLVSLSRSQDWFSFYRVMVSHDRGESWDEIGVNFPYEDQFTKLYQIEYDPWRDRLWVSTPLGLMYVDASELAVAEPGSVVDARPLNFDLLTSWPNPFNDQATIRYHVERSGHVRLELYDVQGRLVRELIDENQPAGTNELLLNADHLPSGTYFLRLDTPDHDQVNRRLTLVK